MSANDKSPDYYKGKKIQPWDYIIANGLGFLEGNVVKYVTRWQEKGEVGDLRKASHYLEKLIEVQMVEHKKEEEDKRLFPHHSHCWVEGVCTQCCVNQRMSLAFVKCIKAPKETEEVGCPSSSKSLKD